MTRSHPTTVGSVAEQLVAMFSDEHVHHGDLRRFATALCNRLARLDADGYPNGSDASYCLMNITRR